MGTTDISDETASTADVSALGSFQFSGNNRGVYTGNGQTYGFNYTITSTNGVDSLICTGGISTRYKIDGMDATQLALSHDVNETNILENSVGNKVYSDRVIFHMILAHNPL